MARPLVADELWELVEPLIPKVQRRFRYPGRKRIDDRKVLTGILFVLKTGIAWEHLPQELGCWSQSCARPTGSIGRAWWSTPLKYRLFWGLQNRPQPRQQAQGG